MSDMDTGPGNSGRRWWEIRGRDHAESDYGQLVTGTWGRTRPERSLSVGVDPVDETGHRRRGLLWPIMSVVAVGMLIVGGAYGIPKIISKSTSAAEATFPVETPGSPQNAGSPQDTVDSQGGEDSAPFILPAPSGNTPGGDGVFPSPSGGIPEGSGDSSGAGNPGGSIDRPEVGSPEGSRDNSGTWNRGESRRGQGDNPDGGADTPTVELDGPAPAAPGPQQDGDPVAGSGGCEERNCTVTQRAPVYLAGTSRPRAYVPAYPYPFLCQSAGSTYSVEGRSHDWWAWVGDSSRGAWIPIVFLAGAPDSGPVPGLPVCDSEPSSTSTRPAPSRPPTTQSSPRDTPSSTTPTASSTG